MRKQISLHVVTAGVAVSAAFAGIHRNHHFDTIQRLHPLLHPLNTGDAPLHSGIGIDYSSFCGGLQSSLLVHEKRDINAPRSISLSSYYNSLVKLSQYSSSQAKCSSEHFSHRLKASSMIIRMSAMSAMKLMGSSIGTILPQVSQ